MGGNRLRKRPFGDGEAPARGVLANKSVDHAVLILLSFLDHPERGVTELSRDLGLSTAAVYRVLTTLESHGLIWRNPRTRRYRLGVRLFELGQAYLRQLGLIESARPVLEQLAQETRQTVHLGTRDGESLIFLDVIASSHPVQVNARVGGRAPLHATASGKVAVAFAEDAVVSAVCQRLTRLTPLTVTDPASFMAQLAEIRRQGYCVSVGEWYPDILSIAAPVRRENGRAIAVIGLAGVQSHFTAEQVTKYARQVAAAARDLSVLFGWKDDGKD